MPFPQICLKPVSTSTQKIVWDKISKIFFFWGGIEVFNLHFSAALCVTLDTINEEYWNVSNIHVKFVSWLFVTAAGAFFYVKVLI